MTTKDWLVISLSAPTPSWLNPEPARTRGSQPSEKLRVSSGRRPDPAALILHRVNSEPHIWWLVGLRPPPRWSSSAARAHALLVSVLTRAEVLTAARRLAGARPHLAAVAGIVHHQDLWQLCRDELTGVDVRIDGWDIRGRWFGVVVGATPRTGELRRGQTIPWRVIAAQIAPGERRGPR